MQHTFVLFPKKTLHKSKKVQIKCLTTIYLLVAVSMEGVLFGAVGTAGAFMEVLGDLR